ncbi:MULTISPECIES: alpha/beta fold hydrolase [Frankia]|uniref:Hydrolase (Partial) n=1 Tax=Frankia alni (strain DSM 45986 / CECT 9034 / ACN14a) TaxID=326424 RepID=Q0RT07_FRAAA|nr:Putative hydrolase (partial) [Frankia alni ACN14a]
MAEAHATRETTVTASDGVRLHVTEAGPPDAALTLVFVHGFCMTADAWHFQRRDLADLGRTVCYDQRAHGRSGPSDVEHCTIAQLADDLHRVLDDRVPTGPVVLIGHSMGGMTVLGLAETHPELFGDRIIAVALLSTSAGELARLAFGLPATVTAAARRVLPGVAVGLQHAPSLLERLRWRGSSASRALTRRLGFGVTRVPEPVVDSLEEMIANTPIPVVGAFLPTLLDHDRLAAAGVLRDVPTLLLVGDADVMTPLEHSRTLAEALPRAELSVEKGAGHAVILERPHEVSARIRELVARARPARRTSRHRTTLTLRTPRAGRPGKRAQAHRLPDRLPDQR